MSHDEFSNALNTALKDYEDQISSEKAEIEAEEFQKSNKPTNRFYFFRF